MSNKLTIKEKSSAKGTRIYVTTGQGKARWPRLNAPDTKFNPLGEYKVEVIVNREEEWAQQLIEKIDSVHEENIANYKKQTKKRNAKVCDDLPYRIVYALDEEGEETDEETGEVCFRFKMAAKVTPKKGEPFTQKPALFDAKRNEVTARIGGGSTVRVSGELYAWVNDALGCGVSLRLKAVQVIELVEFGGGDAAMYGFDEEEGFDGSQGSRSDDDFGDGDDAENPDGSEGGDDDDF